MQVDQAHNGGKRINGTATVAVMCQLPNGLLCELGFGTSAYEFVRLKGKRESVLGIGGITVAPEDFMRKWLKKNADLPYVRKGMIAICENEQHAMAMAIDNRGQKTGFEPLPLSDTMGNNPAVHDGKPVPAIEVNRDMLKALGIVLPTARA